MAKGSPRYFLIFFFLSIVVFTLSKLNLLELPQSYISKTATVVSSPAFFLGDFFTRIFQSDMERKLKEDNLNLLKKLVDQQKIISENKALHDQFQIANPRSLDLLPANVVGSPRFIPGVFQPENFVIDRGSADKVVIGDAVVFKDNLVGKITAMSKFVSIVTLITNPNLKFTAKTQKGILGVVKGEGNGEFFLDNVLLSDHLGKGELVQTVGDLKIDQTGMPPDLIVGQIVSIDANPTSLFQRAKLKTFVDFSKISRVFVIKGLR